jgi:hypothetical protein
MTHRSDFSVPSSTALICCPRWVVPAAPGMAFAEGRDWEPSAPREYCRALGVHPPALAEASALQAVRPAWELALRVQAIRIYLDVTAADRVAA